jgi:hypothetical protein
MVMLLKPGIDFSVGVIVAWRVHCGSGAGFLAKIWPQMISNSAAVATKELLANY